MKAPGRASTSQKLIREIRLARIQLAKAEGQRKSAKEQVRLARRRRKEAKEAARRARKQAKLAKRAVAEAKQILAEAEKKFARVIESKAVAAPVKKATRPAKTRARKSVKPKKPKLESSAVGPGDLRTDPLGQPTSQGPASDRPLTPGETSPIQGNP